MFGIHEVSLNDQTTPRLLLVPWTRESFHHKPNNSSKSRSVQLFSHIFMHCAQHTHHPQLQCILPVGYAYCMLTALPMHKNVRRILVRGVNAPLPPEAKKILKIWLRNGAFWSNEKCSFCMFSLFNFSSIFPGGGQLTTFAPMCGRPCPWTPMGDFFFPNPLTNPLSQTEE